MKDRKIIGLILFMFMTCNISYGQDKISSIEMIQKIDSIIKIKNIDKGIVNILFVTNTFDNTDTDIKNLTREEEFYFDGQFLVIENKYFNVNKLLYFKLSDDRINFFFQGY